MEANYQKLYAYLVGQVDDVLNTITTGGCMAPEDLLQKVTEMLQDALWEAEDRYILCAEAEEGINYCFLYESLKGGVRTAALEAMKSALQKKVTRKELWANFWELRSVLVETEQEFQKEISK